MIGRMIDADFRLAKLLARKRWNFRQHMLNDQAKKMMPAYQSLLCRFGQERVDTLIRARARSVLLYQKLVKPVGW